MRGSPVRASPWHRIVLFRAQAGNPAQPVGPAPAGPPPQYILEAGGVDPPGVPLGRQHLSGQGLAGGDVTLGHDASPGHSPHVLLHLRAAESARAHQGFTLADASDVLGQGSGFERHGLVRPRQVAIQGEVLLYEAGPGRQSQSATQP